MKLTKEILEQYKEVESTEHKIFSNRYVIKIKRNIELVVTDLDTPNFMICLTQIDRGTRIGEGDVISIWNYDYEKEITVEQFEKLYEGLTNKKLTKYEKFKRN